MTTKPHKFTPQAILVRASEYGILVYLKENKLVVEAPQTLDTNTRDKALSVIADHKEDIMAYLQVQYAEAMNEIEEQARLHPEICATCLDQGKETRALPEDYEGFMYCVDHHPGQQPAQVSLWEESA